MAEEIQPILDAESLPEEAKATVENSTDITKPPKIERRGLHLKPYHWPKGVTGNPGGRPKKKPISDRVRHFLEQRLPPKYRERLSEISQLEIDEKCSYGDVMALFALRDGIATTQGRKLLLEMIEGPLAKRIELGGPDGAPLHPPSLTIIFDDDEKVIEIAAETAKPEAAPAEEDPASDPEPVPDDTDAG